MITENSRPSLKRNIYSVMIDKRDLLLLCTPNEPVIMENISGFQRRLLGLLDGSLTVREILERLNDGEAKYSLSEVLAELGTYYDRLLIEDEAGSPSSDAPVHTGCDRYDRSRRWFAAKRPDGEPYSRSIEKKLQDSHIALFGLGGLGSLLFTQLALMGIGRLTVTDYDRVEESNLNRQILFYETDVNRSKISTARARAELLNNSLDYRFIEKRISSPADFAEIMKRADLALLAADTPRKEIFRWMNEASFSVNVPVLYTTGVLHTTMGIGPLVIPGKTACYLCSMPEGADFSDPLVEIINSRHCHGIIIPPLSICAGIMVYEVLRHLTDCDDCSLYDRRLTLDLRTYATGFQEIRKRKSCPYCK